MSLERASHLARLPLLLAFVSLGVVDSVALGAVPEQGSLAFLKQHCVRCLGAAKLEGEVRLDRLTANVAADARLWSAVREQLRAGTMPPEDEKQPPSEAAKSLLDWIDPALQRTVARLPNDGNLVPPELLFGKPPRDGAAAPPRDWPRASTSA